MLPSHRQLIIVPDHLAPVCALVVVQVIAKENVKADAKVIVREHVPLSAQVPAEIAVLVLADKDVQVNV